MQAQVSRIPSGAKTELAEISSGIHDLQKDILEGKTIEKPATGRTRLDFLSVLNWVACLAFKEKPKTGKNGKIEKKWK